GLAYAVVPRASSAITYTVVSVSFLWQLVGSLLSLPDWLLEATPFAHVALVPTQPFDATSAAVMVAVGLVAAVLALVAFRARGRVAYPRRSGTWARARPSPMVSARRATSASPPQTSSVAGRGRALKLCEPASW